MTMFDSSVSRKRMKKTELTYQLAVPKGSEPPWTTLPGSAKSFVILAASKVSRIEAESGLEERVQIKI